ncbi:hypothetical protein RchiOBHm_Chr1g0319371 [Rosa chinensis]|uniref:Uncharacterized protein n=1 Tax=Rosa chinensis TaxID=74649 RepID=A0A2P6S8F8_ROSCH|nr:bifunctional endo-1,4-beta-xylanase XylA [Rosa chinensis]PRQ54962.1 hypothetical protein RchiOBHm_Chr1g0319371 [Rosa chinensis]
MGKWGHRPNRRFFRQEKLPSPFPLPFHPQPPPPSEFWRDGVPQWEKEYCTLIGSIPWWKVVDAKNYMYGSSNVLNWDDSAGEEAFQNAKKRFWADINGLHCDISLPDSDIYIDEIDWNPFIDPDIVKEVDREYFAPDDGDGEGNDKLGQKKRKEHSAIIPLDGHNCLPDNPTNPWECDNMQSSGDLKNEAEGWNQGNNHTDLVSGEVNSWERLITQSNERMENTAWEDRDKSWRWNQMAKNSLSKNWDDGGNPWARDCQGFTHVKVNNRWGDPLNKSWGSNQPETKNLDHGENPWECGPSQYNEALTKDRGWKDCGGWKQCDSRINQRNNLDFRIKGGRWGTTNHSGQKRERSHQYIAGSQSSRFQGSDCQTGGYWRRANNRKRLS